MQTATILHMESKDEKEERYQAATSQKDIRDIKKEVADLSNKLADVHTAIIGSPLAKDGGMVQRLADNESAVGELAKRLGDLELGLKQKEFYVRVIWGLIAFVIGSGVTIFIK